MQTQLSKRSGSEWTAICLYLKYKQYYFIDKMIERKMFDQQINSIKEKYNRICLAPTAKDPNPAEYFSHTPANPYNPNYLFTTPIKHSKNNQEQLVCSAKQRADLEGQESREKQLERIKKRLSSKKEEKEGKGEQQKQERGCLTGRNFQGKGNKFEEFLLEKEKIIKKRVEQNDTLLRKSKELRSQESRKNSAKKQSTNPQILQLKENYNEMVTNNKIKNLFPKQNTATGFLQLTQIQNSIRKTEKSTINPRSSVIEPSQKARSLFTQKMNQVLMLSLKAKDFNFQEQRADIKRRERTAETNMISFMKGDRQNNGQQVKQLKLVTAFDSTAKIQERIKALLSTH